METQSSTYEEFPLLLAALFHDPLVKPWIVIGGPTAGEIREKIRRRVVEEYGKSITLDMLKRASGLNIDVHAEVASLIFEYLFRGVLPEKTLKMTLALILFHHCSEAEYDYVARIVKAEGLDPKVFILFLHRLRVADHLSSDCERFIGQHLREVKVDKVSFIHPLIAERYYLRINVDKFISFLKGLRDDFLVKIRRTLSKCTLKSFNIIYIVLEPAVAYYAALNDVRDILYAPADTRIPTHTVLDHTYATCQLLQLIKATYKEGKIRAFIDGYAIAFNIPGVQRILTTSRKLRDLAASSFLVSLLSWQATAEIIEAYGAHSVITPSLRFNPFALAYVLTLLDRGEREIVNKVINSMHLNIYASVYPDIVRFFLPEDPAEKNLDLKELSYRFQAELVRQAVNEYYENLKDVMDIERYEALKKLFEDGKYYIFVEPREVKLKIDGSIKLKDKFYTAEMSEKILRLSSIKEAHDKRPAYPTFYVKIFNALQVLLWQEALYRKNPIISLPAKLRIYGKGRYTKPCTLCGVRPPLIDGASLHRLEKPVKLPIDDNERLCEYCFMRRMLLKLVRKVKTLKLHPECLKLPEDMIDTFSLSMLPLVMLLNELALIGEREKLDIIQSQICQIENYLSQVLNEIFSKIGKEHYIHRALDYIAGRYREEIAEKYRTINMLFHIQLSILNPEEHYRYKMRTGRDLIPDFKPEKLDKLLKFICSKTSSILRSLMAKRIDIIDRIFNKLGPILMSDVGKYYAIIHADGDNIGKILSGSYEQFPALKDIVRLIDEKILEKLSHYGNYSIISLSYHNLISRALTLLALKTSYIIIRNGGIPIYCGGDDILAIADISSANRIVYEARHEYSKSFIEIYIRDVKEPIILPGLGYNATQSYTIVFSHYMSPLYMMIEASFRELEIYSKNSRWYGKVKVEKDTLTLSYIPRSGLPFRVILPLTHKLVGMSERGEIPVAKIYYDLMRRVVAKILKGEISIALLRRISDDIATLKEILGKRKGILTMQEIDQTALLAARKEARRQRKAISDILQFLEEKGLSKGVVLKLEVEGLEREYSTLLMESLLLGRLLAHLDVKPLLR